MLTATSKLGPPTADVTVMCWGQLSLAPPGQWYIFRNFASSPLNHREPESFHSESISPWKSADTAHQGTPMSQFISTQCLGQYLCFFFFNLELQYFEKQFLPAPNTSCALPGCPLSYYFMASTLSLLQAHVTEAYASVLLHSYVIPNSR